MNEGGEEDADGDVDEDMEPASEVRIILVKSTLR